MYFADRGCVRTLRTLYVYATAYAQVAPKSFHKLFERVNDGRAIMTYSHDVRKCFWVAATSKARTAIAPTTATGTNMTTNELSTVSTQQSTLQRCQSTHHESSLS